VNKDTTKKIFIIYEVHPSNIKDRCWNNLETSKYQIEIIGSKLIKDLFEINYLPVLDERIDKHIRNLEEWINVIEENVLAFEKTIYDETSNTIPNKELKIIDKIISEYPNCKLYLEGSKNTVQVRSELFYHAKQRKIDIILLDEGNKTYEEALDDKGRPIKKSYDEVQNGREEYWIKKIDKTIGNSNAIVIVGAAHSSNHKSFSTHVGYLDKKLKELGYEVNCFFVTPYE
jgi:predicted secreted protein